ncbi:hypothetical protein DLJ47_25380, partial [Micromonospora sp. S4605]
MPGRARWCSGSSWPARWNSTPGPGRRPSRCPPPRGRPARGSGQRGPGRPPTGPRAGLRWWLRERLPGRRATWRAGPPG